MSDDTKQVIVRMPLSLWSAMKERADAEDRSVAQAIRYAMRLYLDRR